MFKFLNFFRQSLNNTEAIPTIRFGRYSDAYKSDEHLRYWEKALDYFKKKNYLRAYEAFFRFLYDEEQDNIRHRIKNGVIHFTLRQGSKEITGTADENRVQATAGIARSSEWTVVVMRKMLEMNFGLRFTSYCIDNQIITLKFSSSSWDASPEKLYYGLKELATKADKQDDLLLHEFDFLEPIGNAHTTSLPVEEKATRLQFLRAWMNEDLNYADNLNEQTFGRLKSIVLNNLAYKLDYLIQPEGKMMDRLEQVHIILNQNHQLTVAEKNQRMTAIFDKIRNMTDAEAGKELYRVQSTFGVATARDHSHIAEYIEEQIKTIDRTGFDDKLMLRHQLIHIPLFCLFMYGLVQPTKELFHLMIEVTFSNYFEKLGFHPLSAGNGSVLFTSRIKQRIYSIQRKAERRYPQFKINQNNLVFDESTAFLKSLLIQISRLNYSKG